MRVDHRAGWLMIGATVGMALAVGALCLLTWTAMPQPAWAAESDACWTEDHESPPIGNWTGVITYTGITGGGWYTISRTNETAYEGQYSYRYAGAATDSSLTVATYREYSSIGVTHGDITVAVNYPAFQFAPLNSYIALLSSAESPSINPSVSVWSLYHTNGPARLQCRVCENIAPLEVGEIALNTWHVFRVVWDLPGPASTGWIRVYMDGELAVDATNLRTRGVPGYSRGQRLMVGHMGYAYAFNQGKAVLVDAVTDCSEPRRVFVPLARHHTLP